MTEAVNKLIPIFAGLLLILRGLLWIADKKMETGEAVPLEKVTAEKVKNWKRDLDWEDME